MRNLLVARCGLKSNCERLLLPVFLCLVLTLPAGCRRNQSEPTPTPAPVVTLTADPGDAIRDVTAQPSRTESSPPGLRRVPNEFTNPRVGYTIRLPAAWQVAAVEPANVDTLLAEIANQAEATGVAAPLQHFAEAGGAQHLDLLAYRTDTDNASVTLSVVTPPRNGLTLDAYLAATRRQLDDATIAHIGLDDTLRPHGLPAGVVQFRTNRTYSYYQIIFFNDAATHFIIMTFAAPPAQLPDLIPALRTLAADVELA